MEDSGPVGFNTGEVLVTLKGEKIRLSHRTYLSPQVIGDKVYILPSREGEIQGIVAFEPLTRKEKRYPLPKDMDPYFGPPAISPDGKKIAYTHFDRQGKAVDIIRSWPELRVISKSKKRKIPGTDVPSNQPVWQGDQCVFDRGAGN
jgi:hypothetical protein